MACDPASSKGGCVPVVIYQSDGNCAGPAGGTKTIGMPAFELEVMNPPDLTWRDEDFTPIQSDDDGTVYLFDNVFN